MENKALNGVNVGKIRKLTGLIANAIAKDVFSVNEILQALEVVRLSVIDIAEKRAANG